MSFTLSRLVSMALVGLWLQTPPPPADETARVPTIKEIMQEAHRCRSAYIIAVRVELQKDEPSWSIVEEKSRELMRMGKLLGKNTPPKGTEQSWQHFTNLYVAHATILEDAAQRKDRDTAVTHQRKLTSMCSTCHRAHR